MSTSGPSVAVNLLWSVPGVGGSEEYLVRQLTGLVEIGRAEKVEVFAPRGFSVRQPSVAESFVVHEAPDDCSSRPRRVALEHTWLAARTRRFDLVHHGGGTVPAVGRRPSLLTIHDVQWAEHPEWVSSRKLAYLRHVVPRSIRRAARIAVPTRFVAGTLIESFGVDGSRIGVVRHGLEGDFDSSATGEAELRRRFALGEGPVLVYPAITHPHKNHTFVLRTLASGRGRWGDPSLRVVFIGSAGSAEQSVRAFVVEHGLGGRVVMPGRVSDADRNGLLAMAAAMVFPSEYEGFGAPLIEAMRLGVPFVASDRACLPEVAGDAGVVAALEPDAWTAALDTVVERRTDIVAKGTSRAALFTAAASAADLVTQYELTAGSR